MKPGYRHFFIKRLSTAVLPAALCFFLTACMTMDAGPKEQKTITEPDTAGVQRRFITLSQIHIGMSREEVRSVIGGEVIIGYQMEDVKNKYYKPVTVNNPYRRQDVGIGSETYEVDFYLLGIKTADGKVTDDELVPLVFHNNKLIGSGWPYLNSLKN